MALTRKLRKGDRFGFPPSTYDPERFPGFTGTITETHDNDGIVWYRDDKTGESSCFISYFRGKPEIEFNALAYHVEVECTCTDSEKKNFPHTHGPSCAVYKD